MSSHASETQAKPTKYYVDFENVHGAGLKGVDALTENDEVIIIYSQAAETFHIEHAIDILKSKARIQFLEADAGTRNAADFQLIVALYADMDDAYDYAIVSGDGGFDAAIKMGERMGKPQVRRLGNIAGDEAEPEKPKSRRSRRSRSGRDTGKDATAEAEAPAQDEAAASAAESPAAEAETVPSTAGEAAEHDETQAASSEGEQKSSSSRRRSRRRKRSSGAAETEEQPTAQNASTRKETDDAYARAAEAMRLASESASARDAAATEKPEPEPAAAEAPTPDASAEKDAAEISSLVKDLLEQQGVQLSDAQVATVASALVGPDGRQGFYRRIIKIERQQNGRALYHQVRDHYKALLDAIQK